MDRRILGNGRVLVLIPNRQKCPEVIKVYSRRRNFSVFVKVDKLPIEYKTIMSWLGLDWVDSDGKTSSGSGVYKGGRHDGFNQEQEVDKAKGRLVTLNDKPQDQVNQSGEEKHNYVCMKTTNGVVRRTNAASGKEKVIMEKKGL